MTTLVIFRCAARRCALPRGVVSEVTPVPELSRPPGLPAIVDGFLNLAGEAVAVVDAVSLFALAPDAEVDPLYRHVLILRDGPHTLGLLVDRVEDVRRVDQSDIRRVDSDGSLNGAVIGEFDLDDDSIHLLTVDRILLSAEKARLADLRRAEQARLDAVAP